MTKLSEKEVLSRSRASCLSNVRKLISWGNDLTDISIIRKTVNLEILNVSVNKVTTLHDLSHCPKLKELYVRKNCIRNIEEVAFLKNLPQLSVLWITDNPMCDTPHYRETIIRTLPNLTKLDSIEVTDAERCNASQLGKMLTTDEVLPNFEGLDLNHTLTSAAVALHIKNNLCSNSDEKLPISGLNANGSGSISGPSVNGSGLITGPCKDGSGSKESLNVNGDTDTDFSEIEESLPSISERSMKDSNTVTAIKLLLNNLEQADLQKILNYTQSLLRTEEDESGVGVVLEE